MTAQRNIIGIGLAMLFLGCLFSATQNDPFARHWFTLETDDHEYLRCVSVLPKPVYKRPIVVLVHGWGDNLNTDGNRLRQMAEMGLATVSLQYDQTDTVSFPRGMRALLEYLGRQEWADTNSIAWVGISMGANLTLDFALKTPALQPKLLIQISGAGLPDSKDNKGPAALRCSVLLIHSDKDAIFPIENTERLNAVLKSHGQPVQLKIIHDVTHGMSPDEGLVFREIGEYCLTQLKGMNALQNYRSMAQGLAEAPQLWLYWLPACTWLIGWFVWNVFRKFNVAKRRKLRPYEIALCVLATFVAFWALGETTFHLVVMPRFTCSQSTLSIARQFLVQPRERADFEFLGRLGIWQDEKLRSLLDHVELANYNRNELINWKLDDVIYRDFVLSPVIDGNTNQPLSWRRLLWEEFYPRIRHEKEPVGAAKIVVSHLRERVTISTFPYLPQGVLSIWLRQITNPTGFEIIYVAALRSVGIGAKLNSSGQAEIWNGDKWTDAPRPVSATFLP